MKKKKYILNSKLRFSGSTETITRERFYPLMAEIRKKRITTVIAGAGYGKSTFVAQAVEYLNLPTLWYRLDPYDANLTMFLHYFITGLKNHFPDLGEKTYGIVHETPDLDQGFDEIFAILMSELEEQVTTDILIVLDDHHTVSDSETIHNFLNLFTQHLPPNIHLIITSRVDTGLHLSLYRARREIIDIRESDLAFSISEIEKFYLEIFHFPLDHASLERLHNKTQGWISALILFYHALRGKNPQEIESLLSQMKGSSRIISNYLEENVYRHLPADIKTFLMKTSILSKIQVKDCDQILQISNSKDILKDLHEKHLFTFPLDEEENSYCYHHLFQDFLQTRLFDAIGQDKINELHHKIARQMEKQGNDEDAIKHYLEAGQIEKACLLIRKYTTIKWSETHVEIINSYLKKIPEIQLNNDPWLQYMHALYIGFSGRHRETINNFEKALTAFNNKGINTGSEFCMMSLGAYYTRFGDYQKGEVFFTELLDRTAYSPELTAENLGHLVIISAHLGKLELADQYFQEAISLLSEVHDRKEHASLRSWIYLCRCFRYLQSGDFDKILENSTIVKDELEHFELNAQLAMYYLVLSFAYFNLGQFSTGVNIAEKGLSLIRGNVFQKCLIYPWLICGFAANSLCLGRINEAIHSANIILKLLQESDCTLIKARVHLILYSAHSISGNLSAADKSVESCKKLLQGTALSLEKGQLNCSIAASFLNKGALSEVLPLLEDAKKRLQTSKFESAKLFILYARFYWMKGTKQAALKKLNEGLKLFEDNQYDFWLTLELHWIVPLLVEIYSQGMMKSYLEKIFSQIGESAVNELMQLQKNNRLSKAANCLAEKIQKKPAPALHVFCLGKFRVFRGDEEIQIEKWRSKNAKMLFKYLLLARDRGYQPKEVLMELLWPDEDPQKTINRLHVTLNSLKKLLEPELKKGIPSSYIRGYESSYRLDLGEGGQTDIDQFKTALALADENKQDPEIAITHYLKAESLYQGDLFEEDLYADWCTPDRDRYREMYLNVLKKLMAMCQIKKDFQTCIEYANKYLEYDKYEENIYQSLMSCYSIQGNIAMVTLLFEKCKERITKDLGCPLSKDTKQLYENLITA